MKQTAIALALFACSPAFASGGNSNNNGPTFNSADQQQGQLQGQAQVQGQLQGQGQSSNNSNTNTVNSNNLNLNSNSSTSKATSASDSSAVSKSGAVAGSYSGGNAQSSSVNIDTDVRPAASAPAISLTSVGTDNCLGSASASVGTGYFSIGGGATTESIECNRRAYSRALRDLGQKDAALALLCLNPEVAKVTAACPTTAAAPGNPSHVSLADPLVCARTGERC